MRWNFHQQHLRSNACTTFWSRCLPSTNFPLLFHLNNKCGSVGPVLILQMRTTTKGMAARCDHTCSTTNLPLRYGFYLRGIHTVSGNISYNLIEVRTQPHYTDLNINKVNASQSVWNLLHYFFLTFLYLLRTLLFWPWGNCLLLGYLYY